MYNDLISKLQVSNRLAQDVPDMAVAAERLLGLPTQRFFFEKPVVSKLA